MNAGDIASTGAADGIGMQGRPIRQEGDVVEAEIEGISVVRDVVGAKQS
ncbi:hypothetical protein MHPYR_480029 [uncultured Mycobacterium sp.]|uniref:Fumarylacetoacetase-like C-terminal domain-containing protein n=1 Tax=uncultured Mycobacterium sp. TaxID=171292 RepID=A0A1Y5PGF0_9MYCO|nr:fumarylacetoacetate hydrolase family protein [Mycolicibacterium aromaticivorans]SBS77762.1 hypothetical protein MHPYR_480029 [uncultured Mycobacterium sp.]